MDELLIGRRITQIIKFEGDGISTAKVSTDNFFANSVSCVARGCKGRPTCSSNLSAWG